ncbi:hypothetical protein VRK_33370 [Vibrio sp. MEBiC08052]|nr:hypothetical protein VRK_33370 [Vibrio sp. MEBiC08052]
MLFEIYHVEEIQHGGAIYDIDNMSVVAPKIIRESLWG